MDSPGRPNRPPGRLQRVPDRPALPLTPSPSNSTEDSDKSSDSGGRPHDPQVDHLTTHVSEINQASYHGPPTESDISSSDGCDYESISDDVERGLVNFTARRTTPPHYAARISSASQDYAHRSGAVARRDGVGGLSNGLPRDDVGGRGNVVRGGRSNGLRRDDVAGRGNVGGRGYVLRPEDVGGRDNAVRDDDTRGRGNVLRRDDVAGRGDVGGRGYVLRREDVGGRDNVVRDDDTRGRGNVLRHVELGGRGNVVRRADVLSGGYAGRISDAEDSRETTPQEVPLRQSPYATFISRLSSYSSRLSRSVRNSGNFFFANTSPFITTWQNKAPGFARFFGNPTNKAVDFDMESPQLPSKATRKGCRPTRSGCCLVTLLIMLAIIGAFAMAIVLHLSGALDQQQYSVKGSARLRGWTFSKDLENPESGEYSEKESAFCDAINSTLTGNFLGCSVTNFSEGSVIVEFLVTMLSKLSDGQSVRDHLINLIETSKDFKKFELDVASITLEVTAIAGDNEQCELGESCGVNKLCVSTALGPICACKVGHVWDAEKRFCTGSGPPDSKTTIDTVPGQQTTPKASLGPSTATISFVKSTAETTPRESSTTETTPGESSTTETTPTEVTSPKIGITETTTKEIAVTESSTTISTRTTPPEASTTETTPAGPSTTQTPPPAPRTTTNSPGSTQTTPSEASTTGTTPTGPSTTQTPPPALRTTTNSPGSTQTTPSPTTTPTASTTAAQYGTTHFGTMIPSAPSTTQTTPPEESPTKTTTPSPSTTKTTTPSPSTTKTTTPSQSTTKTTTPSQSTTKTTTPGPSTTKTTTPSPSTTKTTTPSQSTTKTTTPSPSTTKTTTPSPSTTKTTTPSQSTTKTTTPSPSTTKTTTPSPSTTKTTPSPTTPPSAPSTTAVLEATIPSATTIPPQSTCGSKWCHNGGTCVGTRCDCRPGFHGQWCQVGQALSTEQPQEASTLPVGGTTLSSGECMEDQAYAHHFCQGRLNGFYQAPCVEELCPGWFIWCHGNGQSGNIMSCAYGACFDNESGKCILIPKR